MAYPYPIFKKKTRAVSYDFFKKTAVNWSQFGAPDGYTVSDGYGPDLIIPFSTESLIFINEGSGVIEYSFDGLNIHGELDSSSSITKSLTFNNRVVSAIWFRVKSGSSGPITTTVHAWSIR